MLSVPIGNLTCVGVSAELQVCCLGLYLAYLWGWITGYSHTCIKLSPLGNGLPSDYSGWHLWKWCWKNKISIPRQIDIKPFLLLIVAKNIIIKNNNTDYEKTGIPTQQARKTRAPWTDTSVNDRWKLPLKLDKLGFKPSKQGRQELFGLILQSMIEESY